MVQKPEILFYNFTSLKVPSKNFFINALISFLKKLKEKKKIELSIIFVGLKTMKKLNAFWREKNEPTTVLSFRSNFDELFKGEKFKKDFKKEKDLGEIIFCPLVIKKRAKKEKIKEKDLYIKLLAHSLLHLYGYTHSKKKDSLKMKEKEELLLENK